MAILINFRNVDKYVVQDNQLQKKLPEFQEIFEQWKVGIRSPVFVTLAQKARLDFLSGLTTEHLNIIEQHLNDKVQIVRLNYHLTSDFSCSLDDLECFLMDHDEFDDSFCIARDATSCSISFWR